MSGIAYIHQYMLLYSKLSQVDSQQEQLKNNFTGGIESFIYEVSQRNTSILETVFTLCTING